MAAWYCSRGYSVLDRNWRCSHGELDLVVAKGPVVVFCEVKTRSSLAFGTPAEAVVAAKQARIRRLAAQWLASNKERLGRGAQSLRFDVAAVLGEQIDVIEEAF